jgi:hypothetical protein
MDYTEQIPLYVHLLLASQGKTVQAHDVADVSKGRLRDGNPHAVQGTACGGVDFSLHLFGEGFLSLGGSTMEVSYLPNFRPLGMPKALRTELTGYTSRLRPLEFGRQKISDRDIVAAAVQAFSCRADAVANLMDVPLSPTYVKVS